MLRSAAFAAAVLSLSCLPAAAAVQAAPPVVEVRLSSYDFTPSTIHLHVGQLQVLRLVGESGSHNFSAPALFAASRIDPASVRAAHGGTIELREGDVVEIRMTPLTAGTWPVRCTHLFHAAQGMKGEAIVS